MKIFQFSHQEELFHHAAELFTRTSEHSIRDHGRFIALLSGGTTPIPLYQLLASNPWRSQLDWKHIFIGWCDERCVSPNHEASNFRGATQALLAHVPIPEANVFRIEGERDPESAAVAYESALRSLLGDESGADLAILGLGADGHTASLFPGQTAWQEDTHWFVPVQVPSMPQPWRITATLPLLNSSRRVVFLVNGKEKAEVFARVRRKEWLPATLVHPKGGDAIWLVDKTALGSSRPRP
jgi:6-phosphogluconolactonase